jgi:hypothetical protein
MSTIVKTAVFSIALLVAGSAFASDKTPSLNLTLDHKATLSGTTLEPGDYKIKIERNGDQVQATFISNGKTVTSKAGHFENRSSIPDGVSFVSSSNDGNDQTILEIDASKLKGGIVFDQSNSASSSSVGAN